MAERKCAGCGEMKDTYGGKICVQNSHFVCADCCYSSCYCPLDQSELK